MTVFQQNALDTEIPELPTHPYRRMIDHWSNRPNTSVGSFLSNVIRSNGFTRSFGTYISFTFFSIVRNVLDLSLVSGIASIFMADYSSIFRLMIDPESTFLLHCWPIYHEYFLG